MTEPRSIEELGRQLADIDTRLRRMEDAQTATQASHTSWEDTGIPAYDADDNLRQIIGKHTDGTFAVTYQDGPKPPAPTPATLIATELGLVVYYDGTFAGDVDRPADVERIDIHEDETAGFIADGTTIKSSLPGEGARLLVLDNQPHHVKLVAVTTSGAASDPSPEVSATPLPVSDLAAGAVTADKLAALIVLASRLVAGDPSASRVEINSLGIVAFDADGNRTVEINSDGSAFFDGDLAADTVGGAQIQAESITADALSLGSGETGELLTDPSFEGIAPEGTEVTGDWNISFQPSSAHSGDNFLSTSIPSGATYVYNFLDNVDATAVTTFDVSFWARQSLDRAFVVEVEFEYYDASGALTSTDSHSVGTTTDAYQKLAAKSTVPADAATMTPVLRVTNPEPRATIDVDDASVTGSATDIIFDKSGVHVTSPANLANGETAPLRVDDPNGGQLEFDMNHVVHHDADGTLGWFETGPVKLGSGLSGLPGSRTITGLDFGNEGVTPDSFGNANIAHGLGKSPATVVAVAGHETINVTVRDLTATTFTVGADNLDGSPHTAQYNLKWIAIA